MLNLVGKNLGVSVQVSVLKKMGHIDGSEKVQEFLEEMLRQVDLVSSQKQQKQMKEYKPYLSNAVLAPIVIQNMVENNWTFSDALKKSQSDLQEATVEMEFAITMINIIPGAAEMITYIVGELTKAISKSGLEDSTGSISDKFTCQIKSISEDFWAVLEKLGIVSISEEIFNFEKVTETFQSKMIIPVFNAVYKYVIETEGLTDEDLEDDEKAEIKNAATEFSTSYIVQMVFSTVLSKAIEDDITVAEAMATYERNDLAALVVESLIFSEDLANYAEQLENVIKTLFSIV